MSTTLQCFVLCARQHGVDLAMERLSHDYAIGEEKPDDALLFRMARDHGLKAKASHLSWRDLQKLGQGFPVIARLKNGNSVILAGVGNIDPETGQTTEAGGQEVAHVLDPLADRPEVMTLERERFEAAWDGSVLLLKRHHLGEDENRPFSFAWFVPEIKKQRSLFIEVLVIALFMHAIALAIPIYMQVVLDKVLGNQAFATLYVVTAGIALALLFNAVLGYVRQLLILYASSRIDIRLSTRVYAKLLSLPLAFFQHHTAGTLSRHLQQAGSIRQFLTGKLFGTFLDATALLLFLPVLFSYSPLLAFIVLGFSGLIGLNMVLLSGSYKKRLADLYQAEGDKQSMLVESISGVETVKALALEPQRKRRWDGVAAKAVQTQFEVGKLSALTGQISTLLQHLMIVTIVFVGVNLVLDGSLTAGGLIAFNMLSGRVSGPLVALVSLVQDYQQTALSVRMLGSVMNQTSEQEIRGATPVLHGAVSFDKVAFTYPDGPTVLKDVSVTVPQGQIVGLIGRSGSGKSTMTKLIQGLHRPQTGSLRFDGVDIRQIDLAHLRTHIGIVPQSSFMFRGTIRDNIAAARPDASLEEVLMAARLAGAYEFIEKQKHGFETMLEEGASNLSGGQRQRLAIARAILRQPAILIFDEATSALDPESEMIVQGNLSRIAEGRTMFLVTHRLSQLVDVDRILLLDDGRIVGDGDHRSLLAQNALYQTLWTQQHGHLTQAASDQSRPQSRGEPR